MMLIFQHDISQISIPQQFTFPFHYTPHPLCVMAAEEVKAYIATQNQWHDELERGKMFGVLVVTDVNGETGYLAAFSGNLAGRNHHERFVPPVFDMLDPDGFFVKEEAGISAINAEIEAIRSSELYASALENHRLTKAEAEKRISDAKKRAKEAKDIRHRRRTEGVTPHEESELTRQSQFEKAELKRLEKALRSKVEACTAEVKMFEDKILKLKVERKLRSAELQRRIFEHFEMLNADGVKKNLCEIFAQTPQGFPPAGAGECAAPKLLQFAYRNNLKPIAMAEFWWGSSPAAEVRHHGCYYPACQGKCGPILAHMLAGLDVEPNPLLTEAAGEPEVVYEDRWLLIVNKPAGLLSVPGKNGNASAYDFARKHLAASAEPLYVHRLDMATSGLLMFAKDKETHKKMCDMFCNRTIRKRYVAILTGEVATDSGTISLPLTADHVNRPQQKVDFENGKDAVTEYVVTSRKDGETRVVFAPLTGRTHQLRVHAAHKLGLNAPIKGDALYGRHAGSRLFLHAQYLEFVHPELGNLICIEKDPDF